MSVLPTDAHCHISGVSADMPAAVCAINEAQWQVLSAAKNPNVKKVYGLFLGEAANRAPKEIGAALEALEARLSDASAIGEFGLDKRFVPVLPFGAQAEIFDAHMALARKTGLPFVLHCVGAWGFLLKKVRAWGLAGGRGFLVHSAGCSREIAEEFARLGGYFSFSQRSLASRNGAALAASVPAGRIMLESDAAPSPENYAETLAKVARLRNIDARELSGIVSSNFCAFYK